MSHLDDQLAADERIVRDTAAPTGAKAAAMDRLLAVRASGLREILESWIRLDDSYLRSQAIHGLVGWLHIEEYVSTAVQDVLSSVTPGNPDGDGDDFVGQVLSRETAAAALGRYARDSGKDPVPIRIVLAEAMICTNFPGLRQSFYEALLSALGDGFPMVPSDFRLDRDVDWQRVGPYVGRAIELKTQIGR